MINLIERAVWTGLQTGLALLTVDSLAQLNVEGLEMLLVAGIATVLSALKTFSQDRLAQLERSEGSA